jgi:EAL domain-containing protein (putative c-di-GMP-specific phosphodiesterase class I)/GGDEF domain-containing protein
MLDPKSNQPQQPHQTKALSTASAPRLGAEQTEAAPHPLAQLLDNLLREKTFDIHFQPIVDIDRATILGFEALTRGPANSSLHSPLVLFEVAARFGRLLELERLVIRRALRRFKELNLPGQIFLNLSVDSLLDAEAQTDLISSDLAAFGMPASRLVLELTETRVCLDPERLRSSADALRRLGFAMALDDLGEGFASLKRWLDLKPEFVKIDRHFIDGIAQDPLKQHFVRAIMDLASSAGCTVIAEGLEQASDLAVLHRLGVKYCQGYLLARPSATPRRSLRAEVGALLQWNETAQQAAVPLPPGAITTAAQLARRGHTASAKISCLGAVDMFKFDEQLHAIPVLDDALRPIGLLRSMHVLKRSSERFFMDIHAHHSCLKLMDSQPLIFDVSTSLRTMSEAIANLDDSLMVDGFVVTQDGAYFGSGRTSDLLKAVSDLQVNSARYANPLTLLPGNVPIDSHIDALIEEGQAFVVAVWDIDNFKPFNDVYGYRCGDDIIKFTAQTLLQAIEPSIDFVGHIGGDDFLMVLCSTEWQARLQRVCTDFDAGVRGFFSTEHLQSGGYTTANRQNQPTFHPLPTLSAGVICVECCAFENSRALATALIEPKKVVKGRAGGSRFFVDRRLGQAQATKPRATPDITELS